MARQQIGKTTTTCKILASARRLLAWASEQALRAQLVWLLTYKWGRCFCCCCFKNPMHLFLQSLLTKCKGFARLKTALNFYCAQCTTEGSGVSVRLQRSSRQPYELAHKNKQQHNERSTTKASGKNNNNNGHRERKYVVRPENYQASSMQTLRSVFVAHIHRDLFSVWWCWVLLCCISQYNSLHSILFWIPSTSTPTHKLKSCWRNIG